MSDEELYPLRPMTAHEAAEVLRFGCDIPESDLDRSHDATARFEEAWAEMWEPIVDAADRAISAVGAWLDRVFP